MNAKKCFGGCRQKLLVDNDVNRHVRVGLHIRLKRIEYKAVRGMGDIFPEEAGDFLKLENLARSWCDRYGYGEIRIPLLEPTGLFVRSIGEATDIVRKEMFTFEDAGKKSVTLRPEGTAGVVRAYLEKAVYKRLPLAKYFYLGPMFRRERPQAGRRRQFHQFGTEALGSGTAELDAETIDLLISYLKATGGKDWRLVINSVGCSRCLPAYRKELEVYLSGRSGELCPDCERRRKTNTLRVLDCKKDSCRKVIASAPAIADFLCEECRNHFRAVTSLLKELEIEFELNPFLVRGLDYYTRTVFEVYGPRLGAQDAVAAGGRYDNLVEELGGPSLGAVGFSVGLERLLLSRGKEKIPEAQSCRGSIYCVSAGEEAFRRNFIILARLRKDGLRGEIDYESRSLKAQMRQANRMKVDYALIRGPDEIEDDAVTLKDMKTGEEKEISEEEVLNFIKMTKPE